MILLGGFCVSEKRTGSAHNLGTRVQIPPPQPVRKCQIGMPITPTGGDQIVRRARGKLPSAVLLREKKILST